MLDRVLIVGSLAGGLHFDIQQSRLGGESVDEKLSLWL
jgi:hypothetical protein